MVNQVLGDILREITIPQFMITDSMVSLKPSDYRNPVPAIINKCFTVYHQLFPTTPFFYCEKPTKLYTPVNNVMCIAKDMFNGSNAKNNILYITQPHVLDQHVVCFTIKDENKGFVSFEYLMIWIQNSQILPSCYSRGGVVSHFNTNMLYNTPLPDMPSLTVQNNIVETWKQYQNIIDSLNIYEKKLLLLQENILNH